MVVRRHLLLLDYVAGSAVFRAVSAATVVDINYDEHTPSWNGSGGNGLSIGGGEHGAHGSHDAPASPRPITPPHLDLRARLNASRASLPKPTNIDVDWDPEEPPTRLWNSSSMQIPVPPPLPPPESWAPGFDESSPDHAEHESQYPHEHTFGADAEHEFGEPPHVAEPEHAYGSQHQQPHEYAPRERVYVAQPESAYATPRGFAEPSVPPLPPLPSPVAPRSSRRIATPPPHPTQPPARVQVPHSMMSTRIGIAPPAEPRSMIATRIGIAPPAELPSVLPPPPILPPPPPRERIQLGPALLPEHAHNPTYFPGLSESPLDSDFERPQRKLPLPLIGAGVAVAAISGIGIWLFSGPKTCDVVIETTPADAKVSIDGHPVLGTQSPYSQEKLPLGSHQLLVQKPGFSDDKQSFTLDDHEDKRLLSVKLAAVPAEPKTAPLAVSSVPPGAAIFVDGQPTGMNTPGSVATLRYGYHTVQLRLDGHAEGEQAVKVPDENAVAINLVALQPVAEHAPTTREERLAAYKAKREAAKQARLEAAEARAAKRAAAREARAAKRAEGRSSTSSAAPDDASDSEDPAQRRHELRAAKIAALYRQRKGLPPKDGDEELLAGMSSSHVSAPSSRSSASARSAAPEKPVSAANAGKTGTLMLNTRPWSEVYVDGEHVGHTPVRGLPLRAGHHKIKLENPQMGMTKTISVSIAAGETVTKSETLAD